MEKKEKISANPDKAPDQVASTDPQTDFLEGDIADTYLADSVQAEKRPAEHPGRPVGTVGASATQGCCGHTP